MNRKKEIIKCINDLSGKYSGYEIFTDWIRCLALSIENSLHVIHDKVWQEREQAYIDTMRKYDSNEQIEFARLTACLIDTLEDGPDDVLGSVYMEAGMGSKIAGQFFTPFHLSELTARIGLRGQIEAYKDHKLKRITINEITALMQVGKTKQGTQIALCESCAQTLRFALNSRYKGYGEADE